MSDLFGERYGLRVEFLKSLGLNGPLGPEVYIGNLDKDVAEEELGVLLSLCGDVKKARIVLQKGKSKGFGFVEMSHPLEAVQAISMLHQKKYKGKSLIVNMTHSEGPSNAMGEGPFPMREELPEGLEEVGVGLGPEGKPMRNIYKRFPPPPPKGSEKKRTPDVGGMGGPQDFGRPGLMESLGHGQFRNQGLDLDMGGPPTKRRNMQMGGGDKPPMGFGGFGKGQGGMGLGAGFRNMGDEMGGLGSDGLEQGRGRGLLDFPSKSGGWGGNQFGKGGQGRGGLMDPQNGNFLQGPSGSLLGMPGPMINKSGPQMRSRSPGGTKIPSLHTFHVYGVELKNLPPSFRWVELVELVQPFADVEFAKMVGPGIGQVFFDREGDVKRVFRFLNGTPIQGTEILVDIL